MEGKNYKVSFLETLSAYNTAVSRISEIQDILEKVSTDLNNIINSEAFTGTAAENIKTYASEIHLPLIGAVSCMLVEYQSKLLLYESNYFNIDSDYATKFNAETMAQVQEQVQQYLSDNEAISTEMQTSLNSVSDIISLSVPSKETVDFDLNWMIQKIDTLDESIVNYENLHSTDLDSLKEFIANLETFITYYHESIKPGEYKSGDCANNMYAYQLYESMQVSQEFLKNHEADIVAAGENLQKVADQMQADYDAAVQARIDQGRAEIIKGVGIAVIGGLAIIASAGAATPLVAGALCVTGTCVYGYGISNALEGVDDVYYGMKGDLSSYAFNPIRDTIFMGNQQIYDIWGQANLFAVSVLMPGSNAYSEALNAGMKGIEVTKAVSVAVAKEMVFNFAGDQATGFAVDFMDQHIGLNQTQKALSEIFIGALVDPGTYESIGNFAGNMKAKPDGPSLNDIAHESLLPDNEINFTDFMSAEDAARYNAWSSECANGTHNNFPGLKDVDIEAWKFADGQIATATAMSRIDGSELLKLRGESVKVDADNSSLAPVSDGRHILGDCDYFDKIDENFTVADRARYQKWENLRKDGIDIKEINDFILAKDRPTKAEFERMKLTPVGDLSPEEFRQMQIIRESVPAIDDKVVIRKTVPWKDLDSYINQNRSIKGFVAKADDVNAFNTYGEMRDGLRLDYSYEDSNGVKIEPFPEHEEAYGYIEFTISKHDFIDIPYGDLYGGEYHFDQPYTGNGYTMSNNDFDVPEFYVNKGTYPKGLQPQQGKIHFVVDGEDVVVGDWDADELEWTYHKH